MTTVKEHLTILRWCVEIVLAIVFIILAAILPTCNTNDRLSQLSLNIWIIVYMSLNLGIIFMAKIVTPCTDEILQEFGFTLSSAIFYLFWLVTLSLLIFSNMAWMILGYVALINVGEECLNGVSFVMCELVIAVLIIERLLALFASSYKTYKLRSLPPPAMKTSINDMEEV